jgi:phosphoglycolate phosphatase
MVAAEKGKEFIGMRAAVFDFDGTLAVLNIDFSLMRRRVFDAVRRYGLSEERVREHYLLEVIDEVGGLLTETGDGLAEAFRLEARGILREIELEAAGMGSLLPGAAEALEELRKGGLRVGIVTRNCEEAVRRVFPRIDDCCDVFVSRDHVARVKPHPEQLTYTLDRLGVPGGEALMVGDHPLDITAGKALGMKTAGVLTGRHGPGAFREARADAILVDVSRVPDLLLGVG